MIGVLVKDVVIMDLSGRLEVLFVSAGLSGTISIGDVSNARCLKYLVIVFYCIFCCLRLLLLRIFFCNL